MKTAKTWSLRLLLGLAVAVGVAAPSTSQAAATTAVASWAASLAPPQRFALVIGSNATLDPTQARLRFADDDAAKMTELLLEAGVDVELVTELDQSTQSLHPDLVGRATSPTEEGLTQAWDALRERMSAAQGPAEVELLIYYSGHGDVGPDGQGYLTLIGGKLTRNRLFSEILAKSDAAHNHVLIDACQSEQFVLTRGKNEAWKNDRAKTNAAQDVRRYLDKNHLGGFPNTGVIIAHSADQQTHEWDRYQGGIFSHELMSGLRGGADLNGDGAVEYSELGAFVAAANSGVTDPRARLEVVVRPPKDDERRPVLEHQDLSTRRVLYFPEGDARRYAVEDDRGVRLADIRQSPETPAYLLLPPGDVYVTRFEERQLEEGTQVEPVETQIPAATAGLVMAPDLSFEPAERAARGALDQAFRAGLFATAFGPGYYRGYTDQQGLLGVREPQWHEELWAKAKAEAPAGDESEPSAQALAADEPKSDKDDDHRTRLSQAVPWGGIFFGTVITPLNPAGQIELDPKRVTSNQFRGCLAPNSSSGRACSPLRGFDLRWQVFTVNSKKGPYPRLLGYFRTGYSAGRAEFSAPEGVSFADGHAESLSYLAVPLFLGGNVYAFDKFPLRPYAGLGFGFDVLRVDYTRANAEDLSNVSARIGFELHAGIEGRITNRVALTAEVMQLWSARKRIGGLPDFSNEGFTIITGIAVGFPLTKAEAKAEKRRQARR